MIRLLALWLLSVLVDDAGHHGLAQFAQIVVIVAGIFWVLITLAALASDD